jgi:hypothetical protein
MPQHRTEAARVAQAHQRAVAEQQIEMVMLIWWRVRWQDAQTAGHTQVQDQCAAAAIHQQVFGAALERMYLLSAQQLRQVLLDRPAQAAVADDGVRNRESGEMRGKPAPRDLYFGEFRHGGLHRQKSIGFELMIGVKSKHLYPASIILCGIAFRKNHRAKSNSL